VSNLVHEYKKMNRSNVLHLQFLEATCVGYTVACHVRTAVVYFLRRNSGRVATVFVLWKDVRPVYISQTEYTACKSGNFLLWIATRNSHILTHPSATRDVGIIKQAYTFRIICPSGLLLCGEINSFRISSSSHVLIMPWLKFNCSLLQTKCIL
jgi:hypothetical protein